MNMLQKSNQSWVSTCDIIAKVSSYDLEEVIGGVSLYYCGKIVMVKAFPSVTWTIH